MPTPRVPRSALSVAIPLALALACGAAAPAAAAQSKAFVFGTDFSTGSLSVVDLATRAVSQNVATAGICSDARLRWYNGLLYVVNRFGCNNILVLDPANNFAVVRQFSTGNGTNPSDIVFISPTKAYVPRYDHASLLIVNPSTGASLGEISFAPFNDDDGFPEMDRAVRVGNRVFVSVQRLDRNAGFQPTRDGLIAVIDAVTDAFVDANPFAPGVQGITLSARNPFTTYEYDRTTRRLLIGCAGSFSELDGGIEWVNPSSLHSDGPAIREAALGGNISDFVWNGAARSYAIVSDLSFNARLVTWSATGSVLDTLMNPGGFSLGDCGMNDRDELYVCNNSFSAPGLFVFSTLNDAPLAGPLDTGLPPNQITFDQSSNVTGVQTGTATVRLYPPAPNPARGEAVFSFELPSPMHVGIEIYDVAGRSVRRIVDREWAAGRHGARWDLRDASGARVRPGIYLARGTFDRGLVRKTDTNLLDHRIVVLE